MSLSKPIQPQIQNLTVHRRAAEAAEKKQKSIATFSCFLRPPASVLLRKITKYQVARLRVCSTFKNAFSTPSILISGSINGKTLSRNSIHTHPATFLSIQDGLLHTSRNQTPMRYFFHNFVFSHILNLLLYRSLYHFLYSVSSVICRLSSVPCPLYPAGRNVVEIPLPGPRSIRRPLNWGERLSFNHSAFASLRETVFYSYVPQDFFSLYPVSFFLFHTSYFAQQFLLKA